ncbi:methyltransferase [Alsobacter sp. SYSU M60028]|uniref:Methyltransferase n=1 Tax=Alsobacter ponti TaxID=2962936 RepID=A0ABT1LCP3_9HYPH|nr:methyltransferase [Alsobacter ponti]MCP8939272.1 methyltransferase [Alsobacter ponti]
MSAEGVGPRAEPDVEGAGWRRDLLLGGRLILRQPARGHRAGTDAVLLAAAAPDGFRGTLVDLGAGVGAVGLAVAIRAPEARIRLVEIDPEMAEAARVNAALNGCGERVEVIEADALAPHRARLGAGIAAGDADLVLTNPPFAEGAAGRPSPDPRRRRAHVIGEGGLDGWIKAAADMLRPRGELVVIHRADALPTLLAAMAGRFGGVSARPIHPRAGDDAVRVIARGVKGSRAPFALRPGLVLHGPDGRFTPEAEALHRGERVLRP